MYRFFLFERPSRLFVKFLSLFTTSSILLSVSIPAHAQGFGRWKMDVSLYKYTPPKILLEGTDIQIQVTTNKGFSQQYLDQIKQGLESRLPMSDRRFRAVSHNPETIIRCDVTGLSSFSRTETRYTSVYKKIGERTEYDETTKMTRTVEDYGFVSEPYTATVVSGFLSVLYECEDAKTGILIDSDTITSAYNKEHPHGFSGSPGEAEYHMIGNAVYGIAARFSPYFESFNLLLPKGKLKGASELIQKRMWHSALEKLSAIKEMKDPEKDAFRLYSTAISYHGLSNDAPDTGSIIFYLEKADFYYQEALRKNRAEVSFKRASSMAESSLAAYRKVESLVKTYEAKKQKDAAVAATHRPGRPASITDPSAITNDTVIGWVKSGVSEKEIRSRIKRAKVRGFDLSSGDVTNMLASGVSAATVDEMNNSMRGRHTTQKRGSKFTFVLVYLLLAAPYVFH